MHGRNNFHLGLIAWLTTAALAIYALDVTVRKEDYLSNNLSFGHQTHNFIFLIGLWTVGGIALTLQVARWETTAKGSRRAAVGVLIAAVMLVAAVFAWIKPVTASDPRYYVAYGRQIVLGINPYITLIRDCLYDPIIAHVTPMWINIPSLYGPLGLAPFALGNLLSPREEFFAICSTIRLLYLPAFALMGLLLYRAWDWSRWPLAFTVAVLANPIFLHIGLNSAHVEFPMMFWLLVVCFCMTTSRPALAALAFSAACSTKIVPIALIPVYLCWWFRKGLRQVATFLLIFVGVHGSFYLALNGADYPGVLAAPNGWNNLAVLGGPVIRTFLAMSFSEDDASRYALYGFFLFGGAFCLWLLRTKRVPNPYAVTSITLALLYFFRTTCTPWYTLWYWPFLWLAYRTERNVVISLATWTASLLVGRALGWTPMIWLFTFAYSHNLWLWWQERQQQLSEGENRSDGELPEHR